MFCVCRGKGNSLAKLKTRLYSADPRELVCSREVALIYSLAVLADEFIAYIFPLVMITSSIPHKHWHPSQDRFVFTPKSLRHEDAIALSSIRLIGWCV